MCECLEYDDGSMHLCEVDADTWRLLEQHAEVIIPVLRKLEDSAAPSPAPDPLLWAQILPYGRKVRNRAQTGTFIGDDVLLELWEEVKASQTKCDPEQLFYQHPGECEASASAKGGDANSGARSERSPDMTSAVGGTDASVSMREHPGGRKTETIGPSPLQASEPPNTCVHCGQPAEMCIDCGVLLSVFEAERVKVRAEAFEEAALIVASEWGSRASRLAIAAKLRARAEEEGAR